MPELPEVETIRRDLAKYFKKLRLSDLVVKERRLLQNCSPPKLRKLIGQRLESVGRRAKFLILDFGRHAIVIHLRMTGDFFLSEKKHTSLIFKFEGGKQLYLDDPRRFATLYLAESAKLNKLEPLRNLGVEPFQQNYQFPRFEKLLQTKQEIKRLLLDQRKIAGLGNIYASEILFAAKIHPKRPANELSEAEARRLYEKIPKILKLAIENQGTSIATYRTLSGEPGGFQNLLQVYGREGERCYACDTIIAKIIQGGRSTYFCPQCQA